MTVFDVTNSTFIITKYNQIKLSLHVKYISHPHSVIVDKTKLTHFFMLVVIDRVLKIVFFQLVANQFLIFIINLLFFVKISLDFKIEEIIL